MTHDAANTDRESGAVLLGDHLVEGTDLNGTASPSGVRLLLAALCDSRPPQRVLVIGTMAAQLVDALPESSSADIVVRHLADVRSLAARFVERTEDRYFCGGLELFDTPDLYDLVVLMGGGPEVLSPVGQGMDDASIIAKVAERLTPHGVLLLGSNNPLGLGELLALEPEVPFDDDRRWYLGHSKVSQRPLLLTELEGAIEGVGMRTSSRIVAYPSLHDPRVLASAHHSRDRALLSHAVTRALREQFSERPAARDAAVTTEMVVASGLDITLAPAWFSVVAREDLMLDLPDLVVTDTHPNTDWARVAAYRAGEVTTTWGDGKDTSPERSALGVSRDLSAPAMASDGQTLEQLLREAAANSDYRTLRRLVNLYHDWIRSSSPSGPLRSMRGLSRVDLSPGHVSATHAQLATDEADEPAGTAADQEVADGLFGDPSVDDAAQLGLGFDPVLRETGIERDTVEDTHHHDGGRDEASAPPAPVEAVVDQTTTGDTDMVRQWFATPDNVALSSDGKVQIVDGSWSIANPSAGQLAFVRGLRVFATRLLASGAAHPWRLPVTPESVVRTLASMAGVTVADGDIEMVALLETEVALATGAANRDFDAEVRRNIADGARDNHLPSATAAGFRELLAQTRSLNHTIRAQQRQIAWLEGTLKMRDRRIREYDRLMFKLEESMSYKALRAAGAPKRIAVSKARSRVEEVVPPRLRGRAKRALDRAIAPNAD